MNLKTIAETTIPCAPCMESPDSMWWKVDYIHASFLWRTETCQLGHHGDKLALNKVSQDGFSEALDKIYVAGGPPLTDDPQHTIQGAPIAWAWWNVCWGWWVGKVIAEFQHLEHFCFVCAFIGSHAPADLLSGGCHPMAFIPSVHGTWSPISLEALSIVTKLPDIFNL